MSATRTTKLNKKSQQQNRNSNHNNKIYAKSHKHDALQIDKLLCGILMFYELSSEPTNFLSHHFTLSTFTCLTENQLCLIGTEQGWQDLDINKAIRISQKWQQQVETLNDDKSIPPQSSVYFTSLKECWSDRITTPVTRMKLVATNAIAEYICDTNYKFNLTEFTEYCKEYDIQIDEMNAKRCLDCVSNNILQTVYPDFYSASETDLHWNKAAFVDHYYNHHKAVWRWMYVHCTHLQHICTNNTVNDYTGTKHITALLLRKNLNYRMI